MVQGLEKWTLPGGHAGHIRRRDLPPLSRRGEKRARARGQSGASGGEGWSDAAAWSSFGS